MLCDEASGLQHLVVMILTHSVFTSQVDKMSPCQNIWDIWTYVFLSLDLYDTGVSFLCNCQAACIIPPKHYVEYLVCFGVTYKNLYLLQWWIRLRTILIQPSETKQRNYYKKQKVCVISKLIHTFRRNLYQCRRTWQWAGVQIFIAILHTVCELSYSNDILSIWFSQRKTGF